MQMAINLESVEIGRTENHLVFKGYVPSFSTFYMYEFDYTGVELMSTANLTDKQKERLLEGMLEDFGYAPFNEEKAKRILDGYKQYIIKK